MVERPRHASLLTIAAERAFAQMGIEHRIAGRATDQDLLGTAIDARTATGAAIEKIGLAQCPGRAQRWLSLLPAEEKRATGTIGRGGHG